LNELEKKFEEVVGINFNEYYKKNYKKITHTLKGYTNSPYIDDIINDAFLKILKNIYQFDSEKSSFTTWSTTIMINQSKYNYSKESKMIKEELFDHVLIVPDINYDDNIDEDYYKMLKLIDELPHKLKYIIEEKYLKKREYQDISKETGINISTLKNRSTKAKNILINKLKNNS